jgi:endoglucanase
MPSIPAVLQLALVLSSPMATAPTGQATPSPSLSARNITRLMTPGMNLGNTLEAIPTQTSWGNPVPTDAYFRSLRKAGFKSIRIPAAWTQYSDAEHNIEGKWMRNVTRVVKQALDADLIVLLNVHWDGGWLQPTAEKEQTAAAKLKKFWTQIAANFREFDHRLLFAGTNETGVEGEYGFPTPENARIQNSFNQTFVDAVRVTGGRNRNRLLVVQAYNTDIDTGLKVNLEMPKDRVKDRLLMEVHFYSPYHFTLNEKSDIWQWGKTATDPTVTDTWGNEDHVDAQFAKMKAAFVDRGIPVILGEYCCGMKSRFPGMDKYRRLWNQYVTESSVRHGLAPMYWDTGSIIDRKSGVAKEPELVTMLIQASKAKPLPVKRAGP